MRVNYIIKKNRCCGACMGIKLNKKSIIFSPFRISITIDIVY